MDLLSEMTTLTTLHFVSFQLNDRTFTYLLKLPNLSDLSIDKLFMDNHVYGSNSDRKFLGRPRLNLKRLAIGQFGEFSAFCNLELLTSLSLTLAHFESYGANARIYLQNLRNCTKIQTIHLNIGVSKPNVGSSKNLGMATFRKMPEAGLKIAQKGLKNTFFVKILPRHLVWLGSG